MHLPLLIVLFRCSVFAVRLDTLENISDNSLFVLAACGSYLCLLAA